MATSTSERSSNPFAIVLSFYYNYRRSKLAKGDLEKIVKKYQRRQHLLLTDLSSKYQLPLAKDVHINEVHRIVKNFDVPASYTRLLHLNGQAVEYDITKDPTSVAFDAGAVLADRGSLFTAKPTSQLFDNLSKATQIVPGFTRQKPVQPKEPKRSELQSNEKHVHLFHKIALRSTEPPPMQDTGATSRSPFSTIYELMKSHAKAKIIVRRFNRIRGHIVGFIRAFDKHFNMVLSDVDETFTPSREPKTQCHRHLPSIMVRGDNVVLVCRWQAKGQSRKRSLQSRGPSPDATEIVNGEESKSEGYGTSLQMMIKSYKDASPARKSSSQT